MSRIPMIGSDIFKHCHIERVKESDILPCGNSPYNIYLENETKRLVSAKIIPAIVDLKCNRHGEFQAKPIGIISSAGMVIYNICPKCNADIERQRKGYYNEAEAKRQAEEQRQKMLIVLQQRGVNPVYFARNMNYSIGLFDRYPNYLRGFLDKNLIITGGTGSGKSSYMYEICKTYYSLGSVAEVINANLLISKFKGNYSSIDILQKHYKDVQCLCIDEIDNLKADDYLVIDEVISYFYDNCKKLVFAGNVDSKDFRGLISEKSVSRLTGRTSILEAGNIDLRLEGMF